ncbi:MAG TPA: alpha/beta hydrolase [Pirellulales bacterium]
MIVSRWEGHDAALTYRRWGHGDTHVVFLHGVLRRWDTFLPLVLPLAAHYTTIAVDLRGHGGSSHPACGYRVCDYLSDVVDWLRDEIRHPVVLYGHSLGALVAAGAAAQLPQQVQSVILEDPPFQTLGRRIRETRWHSYFTAMVPLAGSRQPLPELVAQLAALKFRDPAGGETMCLGRLRDAVALRFMADCLREVAPQALEAIVDGGWLAGYDERQTLARLTKPSLLLQADPAAGGMLSDADAELAHSIAADMSLVKLAGAGHWMHGTRTQEVLNLVTAFLATLGPS